jgi:hypothetical protein
LCCLPRPCTCSIMQHLLPLHLLVVLLLHTLLCMLVLQALHMCSYITY